MYEYKLIEKLKSIYWPGFLLESSNVVARKIIIVLCTLLIASNGTTINGINIILSFFIVNLVAIFMVSVIMRMEGGKMDRPIKVSLILIIVSWLVSISYQGAESKLMIGVAICLLIMISVKVNTVILWRKYLKTIVRADTIWDLPERLENITEEISDDRVALYACLFRSYLPDNGVIILESLQRNESLSYQWLEVTYRLKNSKRRFKKVIDIPDESPSN